MEEDENRPAETQAHVESEPADKRPLTDALMADEMGKVFDDMEAHGAEEAERQTVPMVSKNIDEAFENTSNWMEKSADDQESMRDAHGKVERLRANAKTMGLEISDEAALKMALELEQQQAGKEAAVPPELASTFQEVEQRYGQPAHQTIKGYAELDNMVRNDPVRGLSEIIKNTGHDEREVIRQMAGKYSQPQWQQFYAERDAVVYADAFLAAHPDANQQAMLEALGKIERTGDYGRDLRSAYELTKGGRKGGKTRERSMESRMRDIYEARAR